MSLDKAIEHNKEHRKSYTGAKAVDKTCRNHGSDDWANENRNYSTNKKILSTEDALDEFFRDDETED